MAGGYGWRAKSDRVRNLIFRFRCLIWSASCQSFRRARTPIAAARGPRKLPGLWQAAFASLRTLGGLFTIHSKGGNDGRRSFQLWVGGVITLRPWENHDNRSGPDRNRAVRHADELPRIDGAHCRGRDEPRAGFAGWAEQRGHHFASRRSISA